MDQFESQISGKYEYDKLAESFFRLFMARQKQIYSFILSSVPNAAVADDIMQETATVMWSKYGQFKRGTNFAAWGIQIAKYNVSNYYRTKRNSFIQFNGQLLEMIAVRAIQKSSDNQSQRIEALEQCITKLSASDRKVIELRYERGLKSKIAGKRSQE